MSPRLALPRGWLPAEGQAASNVTCHLPVPGDSLLSVSADDLPEEKASVLYRSKSVVLHPVLVLVVVLVVLVVVFGQLAATAVVPFRYRAQRNLCPCLCLFLYPCLFLSCLYL